MILSLKSWWSAEGHRNPLFLRIVEELILTVANFHTEVGFFFVLFFNFFSHPLFRDRNEQQIKACCTCKLFSSRSLLLGFSPAGMFKSFKYVSAVFFKFYKNHSWNRESSIMKMLFMYFNDVILIHLMPLWDLKKKKFAFSCRWLGHYRFFQVHLWHEARVPCSRRPHHFQELCCHCFIQYWLVAAESVSVCDTLIGFLHSGKLW